MTPAEIEAAAMSLPPADRVRLGWSLCESGWGEIPEPAVSPEEFRHMLDERWEAHRKNPAAAVDAFAFLDQLEAEDAAEAKLLAEADRREAERRERVRRAA